MRPVFDTMEVKHSAAAGAALPTRDRWHHTVQVGGTFSADLRIEASDDNSTWVQLAAFTAAGIFHQQGPLLYVRIRTQSFVSGSPVATYGGVDLRADP